jgi:hypothetical protein
MQTIKLINIKKLDIFLLVIGTSLFFSMLFVPFEIMSLKIILLSVLVAAALVKIFILQHIYLSKEIFIWLSIFLLHGIFFTVVGYLNPDNNTGFVIRSATINIVWPLLYGMLMTLISNLVTFKWLIRAGLLALIAIGLYLLFAGLSFTGLLPIPFDMFRLVKPIIGKYEASVQLFLPATTSLLFLIPFFVSCMLLNLNRFFGLKNYQVIIAVILGLVATIMTARRALILNILISPVFIFFLLYAGKITLDKRIKKKIFFTFIAFIIVSTIALSLLVQYDLFDLSSFTDLFIRGFDLSATGQDESSSIRGEQFSRLIDSWLENPILGSGHGAFSQYVIRSDETPWIYELSYVALLFQTGIAGIIIYFSLLIWIFHKGLVLIRSDKKHFYIIPALVGFTCFLIGNASNPYLVAYDHMWAMFLPLCFINHSLIAKKY